MPRIFVSTLPFGQADPRSVELLRQTGWDFEINPTGRKLSAEEVGEYCAEADALIAGTEKIETVLARAKNLKLVARIGIGLDSVPLKKCRELGVAVAYTPDAVTMAVAEATLGVMVTLTRQMHSADKNVRQGVWKRPMGKRLGEAVIGLVGMGRIGGQVVRLLGPFQPREILVSDPADISGALEAARRDHGVAIRQAPLDEVLAASDLVSLHLPYSRRTRRIIGREALARMRKEAFLVNFARGGLVDEEALYEALQGGRLAGAALDCFEREPYDGPLKGLDTVLLTPHLGSSSQDCRARMEIEAVEDVIRFLRGEPMKNPVPAGEYDNQD